MHPFDEMKSYVGFGDADQAALRAFWPTVAPRRREMSQRFYDAILAHPNASAVLADDAQVERLRCTLEGWVEELLLGPWDMDYFARRQRIGEVHVRVGLPSRYMFTAMTVVREFLCEIAQAEMEDPGCQLLCRAIGRVTELDLAIMSESFLERREEKQFRDLNTLIVEHMPVKIMLLDADYNVIASTLTGYGQAVGRPFVESLPDALVEKADLRALVRHAVQTQREITLVRVDAPIDGVDRVFQINLVPLEHAQVPLLIHLEDLTETVEAESRLQRSEALAQLGSLSASVAHELRNPLAGMSAALQLISGSFEGDDRRQKALTGVQHQIRRLDLLVADLLAFARPGAARMERLDLAETTASALLLVQANHADVTMELEGRGTAYADADRVQQVVINLVENAAQAAGPGGRVRIDIERGCVRVSDDGPGVPRDQRALIFAPFYTTRSRGTGLGLAISQRAARTMNGDLVLLDEGALGGATFELRLRLHARNT